MLRESRADAHHPETRLGLSTPLIVVALGQVSLSFNVVSLPIALSGLVKSFGVPPTTVSAAIVMYSLGVAGFVMVGAKLSRRFGAVRCFRGAMAVFGIGQALMAASPNATVMIVAQGLCGLAGAALVPSLVMLIAKLIPKHQQPTALGVLGAAGAAGAVAALLVGGILGTYVGWRPAFALLAVLSIVVFFWSFRLKADEGSPDLQIDIVGAALAAIAVVLISLGVSNLGNWGVGLANSAAPIDFFGISPAPVMVLLGVVSGQTFIGWTKRRRSAGQPPLFAVEVVTTESQRAAILMIVSMGMLEAMLNFAMPLYIQIVQGRSPIETAIATMPFNLSVFVSALCVVRLYGRWTPRQIGGYGFGICAIALFWLAFVVKNDWSTVPVILGLVVFGLAQGALMTLVFSVLVAAAPADLSGDAGALRGTAQNLAVAIGTAIAGALLVGLLSAAVLRSVAASQLLSPDLLVQVDLDNINFVANSHLKEVLAQTSATSGQVEEALRINTEARLRAMKIGFLIMGGLALLTIAPTTRLPKQLELGSS
ncbi:MFS transporter [Afipia sp. TerB]